MSRYAESRRRPWSPDPYEPLPSLHALHTEPDHYDPWHPQHRQQQRRETSDVSVEALDLADYAMTLRPAQLQHDPYDPYSPSPQSIRPFAASRDSLAPPPSLTSASTNSHSHSNPRSYTPASSSSRRHFSLPPPPPAHRSVSSIPSNRQPLVVDPNQHPYGPPPDSEIDIANFPAWSRTWYNQHQPKRTPPHDPYDLPDNPDLLSVSSHTHKLSPFDPAYQHHPTALPYDHAFPAPAPYSPYSPPPSSSGHARDLVPWGADPDPPSYAPPLDPETKQERMRMLQREFGPRAAREAKAEADADAPMIGSVDEQGRLITAGPKKRAALRILMLLLAVGCAAGVLYAALVLKPAGTPPPRGTVAFYALCVASVVTAPLLLYLLIARSCCGGRRAPKGPHPPGAPGGMMVLPVQGGLGKKGKKPKKGKKGGPPPPGDVQVNLIVDPSMFGRGHGEDEDEDDEEALHSETDEYASMPGGYNYTTPRRPRRRRRRRGLMEGLALEERWAAARTAAKRGAALDAGALVLWGAVFVVVLLGKRCPSGDFEGWCDAYNVSTACACLLAAAFGVAVFFGVKDLHASGVSPRTRV